MDDVSSLAAYGRRMDEGQTEPQDEARQPAATNPAGQQPAAKKNQGVLLLGVGAVLLVCCIWAVAKGVFGGDSAADKTTDAKQVCEQFVKDQLKSPGSAKFTGASASTGGSTYTVTGDVDAQNSFGGLLRSHYTCVVRLDDQAKEWRLVSLSGIN